MAGAYILAPIVGRQANLWNIIALAAILILMHTPNALQDLGFIFSFTAVISIVFFYNQFQNILPEKFKNNVINNKQLKFLLSMFLVSLSAQIGTLPLSATYFHRVPIIALVANVLIVPMIGILVAIGFLILFFGWIPGLGFLLGQAAWSITVFCEWLAKVFSKVPYGSIHIPEITIKFYLTYFLIVAAIFIYFYPKYRRKGIIILLLAGNLFIWSSLVRSKTMDIIFLDVGQGDGIIIRFPGGKTMLLDAGNANEYTDYGVRAVIPTLNHLGVKRLNWVVMSHPHSDHIGGLISVIESFPVDTVWNTYIDYTSKTYKYLLKKFADQGSVIKRISKGDVYILDYQIYLKVFSPDSVFSKFTRKINNSSIMFTIIFGETSILFTGDMEKDGDSHLRMYGANLKADILKVAHHGSKTSTTQSFLDLVSPDLAVISVGLNNKFNHPSEIVIERILASGAEIHRTDLSGALWIRINRKKAWIVNWK